MYKDDHSRSHFEPSELRKYNIIYSSKSLSLPIRNSSTTTPSLVSVTESLRSYWVTISDDLVSTAGLETNSTGRRCPWLSPDSIYGDRAYLRQFAEEAAFLVRGCSNQPLPLHDLSQQSFDPFTKSLGCGEKDSPRRVVCHLELASKEDDLEWLSTYLFRSSKYVVS